MYRERDIVVYMYVFIYRVQGPHGETPPPEIILNRFVIVLYCFYIAVTKPCFVCVFSVYI